MIKIRVTHGELYKDLNYEKGEPFYALPTKTIRRQIWFLGIKVYDNEYALDINSDNYIYNSTAKPKEIGFNKK